MTMAEIPLSEIEAARGRIFPPAIRTPLVRLNLLPGEAPADIFLKLENLQPIGSFKIRGASNAMALADPAELAHGVYTASAGNMAQGVAWNVRQLGIPCSVIVPDHAPETKLAAIRRLGATIIPVPFDTWWQVILSHRFEGMAGKFIHPVSDLAVMAGNGTIGLEILEDLPEVDAVIIPYGGGGLTGGVASALRALKPGVRIFAGEVATAAPVSASLAAGSPQAIESIPSFVDGIGGKSVLPEMWPLISRLIDGAAVAELSEVEAAVRLLLERNRILAEGAGATPVAAALAGRAGAGRVVCIVSGGNLDLKKLISILAPAA